MKKILAVATALVLAISSLCVFVFADETTTTFTFSDVTLGGYGHNGVVDSDGVVTLTYSGQYQELKFSLPSSVDANALTAISFDISSGNVSDFCIKVYVDGTALGTYSGFFGVSSVTLTSDQIASVEAASDISIGLMYNGTGTNVEYVINSFTVTTSASSGSSTTTVKTPVTLAVSDSSKIYGDGTIDMNNDGSFTLSGDATGVYINLGTTYSVGDIVTLEIDGVAAEGFRVALGSGNDETRMSNGGNWTDATTESYNTADGYGVTSTNLTSAISTGDDFSVTVVFKVTEGTADTLIIKGLSYRYSITELTIKSVYVITEGNGGELVSTSTASGIIYVNEDYHALLLNGYFISIPHTDDNGDGYCDVCCEYIGSEDSELEVVTIDGVDYYVVVSNELNSAAGNWNSYALGDSTFAAALNTEGAILQITRDTETAITFVDGEIYEKFIISASSNVALGTGGHTIADEASVAVDATSDDGYVVTYDGAAVYAALEAAGIADASSYSLISNTSESYTITSVAVLVPVGTVVGEDVDVSEPAEVGDTTTEDDGEEDADSVDVADNADDAAESNPTTGVVLALVPMAIAGFAVVSSKRR